MLFQTTDITKEIKDFIKFIPFNFYQTWARRVLVFNRYYQDDDKTIEYKQLDRVEITKDSEKYVHLVIIGMTRMGIALATEAAHICHFRNFITKGIKTKITFIDENARKEMEYILGHYKELFKHSYYTYSKFEDGEKQKASIFKHTPKRDFLDVEWEFIEANIATENLQNEIALWSEDEKQVLTIACCLKHSQNNIATGFYFNKVLYEKEIPILILQSISGQITSMLSQSKFRNVFPFGMIYDGYDKYDESVDYRGWARKINYVYCQYDDNGIPELYPEESVNKDWDSCSITGKWSNIYNAISIPTKLRSIGIDSIPVKPEQEISEDDISILAEIEHNRWNVEKLMCGYRPTEPEEDVAIESNFKEKNSSKDLKKEFKDEFIHYDIRPYKDLKPDQTDKNVNRYDIALSRTLLDIIKK